MNIIDVQSVTHGHGGKCVAGHEFVIRTMRLVGMFQHPDPFGVAGKQIADGVPSHNGRHRIPIHIEKGIHRVGADGRQIAVGVIAAIAVQIQVIAEIVTGTAIDRHKYRRAGQQEQIRDVLVALVRREKRRAIGAIEIIHVGRAGNTHGKAQGIDVVRGDKKVIDVGGGVGGENVGSNLRLGGGEGGLSRMTGGGGIGGGGDGIALAMGNGEQGNRHDQRDGKQNQRDDQGHAPGGGARAPGRRRQRVSPHRYA